MSANSSIEWTEATWNPVAGCTPNSPGCLNCYAARMAHRLGAMGQPKYRGLTILHNARRTFNGDISFVEEALTIPLRRKKPTVYFVNSMSDLFHEDVPFEFVDRVFAVMALTPQHTYQVLTKRPERMAEYMNEKWQPAAPLIINGETYAPNPEGEERRDQVEEACEPFMKQFGLADTQNDAMWTADGSCKATQFPWPLPNVCLGCSPVNQKTYDEYLSHILRVPAAVRFLSLEPLLGPIDLLIDGECSDWHCPQCGSTNVDPEAYTPANDFKQYECRDCKAVGDPGEDCDWKSLIHWVIVGGESGPGARPCNVDWIRSIVSQCKAAGVPVFVKQLGAQPVAEYGVDYVKRIKPNEHGLSAYEIEHKAWPMGDPEILGSRPLIRSDGVVLLKDRKGGDPVEWPEDLRVREMPATAGVVA